MDCFIDREGKYRRETAADAPNETQPNDPEPNILTTTTNDIRITYVFFYPPPPPPSTARASRRTRQRKIIVGRF